MTSNVVPPQQHIFFGHEDDCGAAVGEVEQQPLLERHISLARGELRRLHLLLFKKVFVRLACFVGTVIAGVVLASAVNTTVNTAVNTAVNAAVAVIIHCLCRCLTMPFA